MDIIDAHYHIWDTRRLQYSLFAGVPDLNRPYLPADYAIAAAECGIVRSVCVEAASAGADGLRESTWLSGQAGESGFAERIVVWAPLESPCLDTYWESIAALSENRIVGVRRSFEFEDTDFAARLEVIAGVRSAGRRNYAIDVVCFSESLPAVTKLVAACPDTQFILDHLGKPLVAQQLRQPWQDRIARLARLPNIVCKLSGLTTEADRDGWNVEDLRFYIDHAINCFGWDRVLFGSDWPVCNLAGGPVRWLNALQQIVDGATAEQRRQLFRDNAERVYRM